MSIPYPKLDNWIPLCTFKHGPIPMIMKAPGYWKCPSCGKQKVSTEEDVGLVEDFGDTASAC